MLLLHEARQLLRIAGPIILAQLGGVGMNTMDTIMVGPLGASSLAAAGLSTALHVAVVTVFTGTLFGLGPLVSHAFGAGDDRETRRLLIQGLWIAVALSIPLAIINLHGGSIAAALGQLPEVVELSDGYMGALAWGVLPLLLFMAFRQYLEGRGIATPTMIITFLGLGVNFVGNTVFIWGVPELGIRAYGVIGSGWSTTVVRWAMLGSMCYYVMRNSHPGLFSDLSFRWQGETIRRIVWIGAPTGVQIGLEVGLFSFAAVMVGWIDELSLAAHQVTISLASTTFMVALGVSLAGAVRVGHSVGARSAAGVRRAVLLTLGLAVVCMSIFAFAFVYLPEHLLRLYTSDDEIVRIGIQLLTWAAIFQVFDGVQVAAVSVLRGAADTRVPMIMAAVAYWFVGAPAAYYFGFHYWDGEAEGVWAGLCLSLVVASLLLGWRIREVLWKRDGRVPLVRA